MALARSFLPLTAGMQDVRVVALVFRADPIKYVPVDEYPGPDVLRAGQVGGDPLLVGARAAEMKVGDEEAMVGLEQLGGDRNVVDDHGGRLCCWGCNRSRLRLA
jgi:hypothetical protein